MAGIDDVLERLVGDQEFRTQLASDPVAALKGYDLTRDDLELLANQFDDGPDAQRSVEQRTSKSAMMGLLSALGGGGGGGGTSADGHKGWVDLQSFDQSMHKPGAGAAAATESPIAASRFGISMDGAEIGDGDAKAAFIKFDGVDGESRAAYVKFDGVDGESKSSESVFVKIDTIKGESSDAPVEQLTTSGDADDRPTEEVAFAKDIDKSTPLMMDASDGGGGGHEAAHTIQQRAARRGGEESVDEFFDVEDA